MISLPGPDAVLYPRDKVLLLGTSEQLEAGKQFLTAVSGTPPALAQFDDVRIGTDHHPRWSRAVGVVLSELDPAHHHQVQIAGIHRRGVRILTPGSDHGIESGDQLLALGAPEHLRAFKDWVNEEARKPMAREASLPAILTRSRPNASGGAGRNRTVA